MKLRATALAAILATVMTPCINSRELTLRIAETTDVHGNYFPYDFIGRHAGTGSLARVATFIDSLRQSAGAENVVLIDNGDILQGQPTAYYYNYIDTASKHLASDIYDFMGYDVATIGNHDVETGHAVYDRWIRQTKTPVLGANIIDRSTGEPYLTPYKIIERNGVKMAFIGMLTEAIPAWLPENLWSGLRFEPVAESAAKWVAKVKEQENPDVIIGLFHSGRDYNRTTDGMMENASLWVGENVPGYDVIFFGHDHQVFNHRAENSGGRTLMLNPANNARNVAVAELTFDITPDGKATLKESKGEIADVTGLKPSDEFMKNFRTQFDATKAFVDREVGTVTASMSTRDAFFGPSTFMQLVHELQKEISGAEISLAAPLSFDAAIERGPLHVSDMFTLYKYENMLYTMRMTGQEIKDYLEMAYSLWTDRTEPGKTGQHLLAFASATPTPSDNRLRHPSYNFDSAFGIDYTVDVTKPRGEKITISGMSDGTAFDPGRWYTVAVNSYRGNGGGDLMTEGAGIDREELKIRIVKTTDHDLRYYLMREIEKRGTVEPRLTRNWKFVPESVVAPAVELDRQILFGPGAAKEQK